LTGVVIILGTVLTGEYKNGQTIALTKNQILELSLITNPSTGYTWQYVQHPNPKVLQEIKHYLVPQGSNPGSPSLEYWLYNPINPGITSISLKYNRSWSKEPPLKTFQVNIVTV
jgi:inhibitor of cysteine peptidase